jgi:hypothetical protein
VARTQFFGTVTQSLQQIAPMIAGNPKTGEASKELVMFTLDGFKPGRPVVESVERVLDEAIQMAAEQKGQEQPNPDAIKLQIAQVGLQTAQVKLQTEQTRAQNQGAENQREAQKIQLKQVDAAQKVQAQQDQNQAKRAGHVIDLQGKAEKVAFERATRATAEEALTHGPTRAPHASMPQ